MQCSVWGVMLCGVRQPSRIVLIHEVKALIWEQCSKALSQVVVGILCESHLLHSRQLAVAGPDLLTWWPQILQTKDAQTRRQPTVNVWICSIPILAKVFINHRQKLVLSTFKITSQDSKMIGGLTLTSVHKDVMISASNLLKKHSANYKSFSTGLRQSALVVCAKPWRHPGDNRCGSAW